MNWLRLVTALVLLGAGFALGHGLLIVLGLIVAVTAYGRDHQNGPDRDRRD
jgi:hypothetical protein